MINIYVWRDRSGEISRFRVEGHAGYAEHGSDIVCSAVSALVQTAVLGLMEVAGVEVKVHQTSGLLDCRIVPSSLRANADDNLAAVKQSAILETMMIGLSQIAGDYHEYVRIVEKA